ncbi:MAG: N-acetyltransferase [Rhodothermales bacterium]|nr:N-acetyltransferase [Rhodothermales bacterium]
MDIETYYRHPTARLGAGTEIGRYCVVSEDVEIGPGCLIGHHVVVHAGARIGSNVRIDDHAVIGKQPMRAPNSAVTKVGSQPAPVVGSDCIVGTGVVLYAGSMIGNGVLVADFATIRERVRVGDFTIVGRGVSIENDCIVGRYCKLETNVYLAAYSEVEDRCFIAPGVLTSNDNFIGRTKERFKHFKGVTVRRGGRIGVGAVVLPGKEVGPDSVVAAGAVLTKDAEGDKVYTGVPARKSGDVPDEQKLDNQGWED